MWFSLRCWLLLVCLGAGCCRQDPGEEGGLKVRPRHPRSRHNYLQEPSSSRPGFPGGPGGPGGPGALQDGAETNARPPFSWAVADDGGARRSDKIRKNADAAPPNAGKARAHDVKHRRRDKRRRLKPTPDADADAAARRAKQQRRRERRRKDGKLGEGGGGGGGGRRGGGNKKKPGGSKVVNKALARGAKENDIDSSKTTITAIEVDNARVGGQGEVDNGRGGGQGEVDNVRVGGQGEVDNGMGGGQGEVDNVRVGGQGEVDNGMGGGQGEVDNARVGGQGEVDNARGGGQGEVDNGRGGGQGEVDNARGGGQGEVDNAVGGLPDGYQRTLVAKNRKLAGGEAHKHERAPGADNVIPAAPAAPREPDDNLLPVLAPPPGRGNPGGRGGCRGPGRGGCEQVCTAGAAGAAVCSCYRGFRSAGNRCHDFDECSSSNGGCQEGCRNTLGSFRCTCPHGFRVTDDGRTCRDVDECLLRNGHGPCQDRCTNKRGGYACACDGLRGTRLAPDQHGCLDVDECAAGSAGCSHLCLNTLGNAFCLCPPGMLLGNDWKTCQDIDECAADSAICPEKCVNTVGSYHCTDHVACPAGYSTGPGDDCEDEDECQASSCSQLCVNTNGSYHCGCEHGYNLQEDRTTCLKIVCPAGYEFGSTECEDIDECENSSCSQLCVNTNGSYHCGCEHGYRLQEDGKTCSKVVCPEGFRFGTSQCEDVDECIEDVCSQRCVNTNGSYHCGCEHGYRLQADQTTCLKIICPEGFRLGSFDCEDVDECEGGACSHHCANTPGSFRCSCDLGYNLQDDEETCLKVVCADGFKFGAVECEDVDECEGGACSHHCANTPGSFRCSCKAGFTLQPDATTCSRKLVCPEGFRPGGARCEDVDECEASDCEQLCINTPGSYQCACKLGFVLRDDRRTCSQGALTAVCPPLEPPAHGYLECFRLRLVAGPWRHRVVNHSGSVCKLRCPRSFRRRGLYRRFCGQAGVWLGLSSGRCEPLPSA